ncbi:MAG: PAS domain S-box protein [Cyanobacteriota bacterium]|nr:PAS domain S-box protein [Cyanobacteriota bacterium]
MSGNSHDLTWLDWTIRLLTELVERLEKPNQANTPISLAGEASDAPLYQTLVRYQGIANLQTDLVTCYTPDFIHTFVNQAYCQLIHKSADQVIGHSIFEFIPPEKHDDIRQLRNYLTVENPIYCHEEKLTLSDRSILWYEWIDQGLFDQRDQLLEIQSVGRDITERKRTEQILQDRERRFRLLAENASDMIFRFSIRPALGFEYVSAAATNITGYTPEEHYANPNIAYETFHPDDIHLVETQIKNRELFPQPLIYRYIRKDGTMVWVDNRITPIYDENGILIATEGIIRDVTQLKQAECALRQQIKREETLNQLTQIIHQLLDLDQIFVNVVQAFVKLLGVDRAAINRYFPNQFNWLAIAEGLADEQKDSSVGLEIPDHNNPFSIVLKNLQVITITPSNPPTDPINQALYQRFPGSWLLVPIALHPHSPIRETTGLQVWGSLAIVIEKDVGQWSPFLLSMMESIAEQLSTAIHQAELYQELRTLNQDLEQRVLQRTEELQQNENLYRAIVEDQTEFVSRSLPDTTILFVNGAICRATGKERTYFPGKRWIDWLPDDQKSKVLEGIAALTPENPIFVSDNQGFIGQHEYLLVQWTNRGIFNQQGQLIEIQAVGRDITKQKKAEDDLRKALEFESLLKRITDNVRDSLDEAQILDTVVQELGFGLGVDGCNTSIYDFTRTVAVIEHEFRLDSHSILGRVFQLADYPHNTHQLLGGQYFQYCDVESPYGIVATSFACPIRDDQEAIGELWLTRAADQYFSELEIRLVEQVATQCAIGIRQARLYQAAQQQVEELEKLNQLKEDFLATVSHELRTPMTNIKMALQMLKLTYPNPRSQHYLQILEGECDREIRLINDLLDLQREESFTKSLNLQILDLATWLPQLLEPFALRFQQSEHPLQIDIAANLPTFETDVSVLERILTELLINALKYTPSGQPIRLSVEWLAPAITFVITNFGVEIPAHYLPRLFEKFFRLPDHDRWRQSGTGLGLALVKQSAESLGGSIKVESRANQTTFTLRIPPRLSR